MSDEAGEQPKIRYMPTGEQTECFRHLPAELRSHIKGSVERSWSYAKPSDADMETYHAIVRAEQLSGNAGRFAPLQWRKEPPDQDGMWLACLISELPYKTEIHAFACVFSDNDMVMVAARDCSSQRMTWRRRADEWFTRRIWYGPFPMPPTQIA